MSAKRPPNPNTAYGRRRIQEEKFIKEQQWRSENPNEAAQNDTLNTFFGIIIVLIFLAGFILKQAGFFNDKNDHYGERGGHYRINSHGNKEYYKNNK